MDGFAKIDKKHESYLAEVTSNNILFCFGGVDHNDNNLGFI